MRRLAVVVGLVLAGCSVNDESTMPTIVVTHSVLGAVVQAAVPEEVKVEILIPNGAEVHDFEPSARDIEKLNRADLLVVNGAGLEESLAELISAREADGGAVFVVADHIAELGTSEVVNPHFFTAPDLMAQLVPDLIAAIEESTRIDADESSAMAMLNLARESASKFDLSQLNVITGHDFLGYFCASFGCDVIGSVVTGGAVDSAPSPQHLEVLNAELESDDSVVVAVEPGGAAEIVELLPAVNADSVVEIAVESLPESGGYPEYISGLARALVGER